LTSITFLGACREVGRSAVLIESNKGDKLLLDYGVRFNSEERLPCDFNKENLKAIALTHSHIDHSGALPFIYKSISVPFFTNPISLAVTQVLINDMIRISNYSYPFGFKELNKLMQHTFFLKNYKRQKVTDDIFISFIDAGHIPGSVSILVEVDDKKILYTGDINNQETNLVYPTNSIDIPEIDVLITESTYALRNHPSRDDLEKKFVESVINVTDNGGKVVIPAFGLARSQEALLILNKYRYNGKIYIDGLSRRISRIFLDYPLYIKDIDIYREILSKAIFVSKKGRKNVKNIKGVIIAPSGMLKGGAAINFVKSVLSDPLSAIYLIGYQVEGSPGRELLDDGYITFNEYENIINDDYIKEKKIKAKCHYEYFEFSSHADGDHIRKYINEIKFRNSSKYIFTIHGDNEAAISLANEFAKKSYISVAPEIGEVYKI